MNHPWRRRKQLAEAAVTIAKNFGWAASSWDDDKKGCLYLRLRRVKDQLTPEIRWHWWSQYPIKANPVLYVEGHLSTKNPNLVGHMEECIRDLQAAPVLLSKIEALLSGFFKPEEFEDKP
jgi:hypothetical protein